MTRHRAWRGPAGRLRTLAWSAAWAGMVAIGMVGAAPPGTGDLPRLPENVFGPVPPLASLPVDVFARPEEEGAVDVVLFSRTRAAVVRIDVTIGDAPYKQSYRGFLRALHAYLDRDDDGVLTPTEATTIPWTSILNNPIFGGGFNVPNARLRALDSAPADGVITVDELDAYIRDSLRIQPLAAQIGSPPDARAEALLGQLDADGDRRVTADEGASLLGRLDADEDEFVSLDELTPDRIPSGRRAFFAAQQNVGAANPRADAAVFLDSDATITLVAARLIDAFGKNVPGPTGRARRLLPNSALVARPGAVDEADLDHDGHLNRAELEAFLLHPGPALTLGVGLPRPGTLLGPNAAPPVVVSVVADAVRLRDGENGRKIVHFDDLEFTALAAESNQNFDDFMRQQFDRADTNKDGRVDAKESRANSIFQRLALAADRDRDSVVTRAEFDRYLDLSRDSGHARAVASVGDRGTGLFSRVDANADNRLSLRELRAAASKLTAFDRNQDGRLDLDELPRRYELTVGRSRNVNRQVFVSEVVATSPTAATAAEGIVPVWFQGMDRNGDGDVSPREFLGPIEVFRRLDADNDGLIDAREAQQLR